MTDLQNTFEYVGLTGHVLSVAEQTALACSLPVVSSDLGTPVVFWGKVFGFKGDYLVAQTVSTIPARSVSLDDLGSERSLFSTDGGHNWALLSPPDAKQAQFCEQLRGRFVGKPDHLYKVRQVLPEDEASAKKEQADAAEEAGEEEEETPEEEAEEKDGEEDANDAEKDKEDEEDGGAAPPPAKKKKKVVVIAMEEATRLAFFVKSHNTRCRVIPAGQLLLTENAKVTVNKTWTGLTASEAVDLYMYCHLRKPEHAVIPQQTDPHYNSASDFMEPLSTDIPEGVWTLQYDPSMRIVVGKNFLYPVCAPFIYMCASLFIT
ncbi:radial spoke head protein 9 [Diplonema papillatum]|nr:radial spoke head protein 9 [Diplonema papillatum]